MKCSFRLNNLYEEQIELVDAKAKKALARKYLQQGVIPASEKSYQIILSNAVNDVMRFLGQSAQNIPVEILVEEDVHIIDIRKIIQGDAETISLVNQLLSTSSTPNIDNWTVHRLNGKQYLLSHPIINRKYFPTDQKLGSGGQGKVKPLFELIFEEGQITGAKRAGKAGKSSYVYSDDYITDERDLLRELPHLGFVDEFLLPIRDNRKQFLVMEEFEGMSLRALLYKTGKDNYFTAGQILQLSKRLFEVLGTQFHAYGIFHGDIKPDNIMVNISSEMIANGLRNIDINALKITIIDVDTAQRSNPDSTPARITTPGYIPPEAFRSWTKDFKKSDSYGVAMIAAELFRDNSHISPLPPGDKYTKPPFSVLNNSDNINIPEFSNTLKLQLLNVLNAGTLENIEERYDPEQMVDAFESLILLEQELRMASPDTKTDETTETDNASEQLADASCSIIEAADQELILTSETANIKHSDIVPIGESSDRRDDDSVELGATQTGDKSHQSISENPISAKYIQNQAFFYQQSKSFKFQIPEQNENSTLTVDEYNQIKLLIERLHSERTSLWPYPNKERKLSKIDALIELIVETNSGLARDDIIAKLEKRESVIAGRNSRTADLLDSLKERKLQDLP